LGGCERGRQLLDLRLGGMNAPLRLADALLRLADCFAAALALLAVRSRLAARRGAAGELAEDVEALGLQRLREPASGEELPSGRRHGRRAERVADLLEHARARRAAFAEELLGVAVQPLEGVALRLPRPVELLLLGAAQDGDLRLAQPVAGVEQEVDVAPAPARQLIQHPGCDGRLPELRHGVRVVGVAGGSQFLRDARALAREVLERHAVELVDRFVEPGAGNAHFDLDFARDRDFEPLRAGRFVRCICSTLRRSASIRSGVSSSSGSATRWTSSPFSFALITLRSAAVYVSS